MMVRRLLAAEADRILAEAVSLSPREVGPLTTTAPRTPLATRRRSLRCSLGIHRWKYFQLVLFGVIDMGEYRRECIRCGKWARA